MSRFIEDVNRMFDEILRVPWKRPPMEVRHPGPAGPDTVWEVDIPLSGGEPEQFGVVVDGTDVTVTVGARVTTQDHGRHGLATTDRYEQRRQSFRLPQGAKASAVEARVEGHSLHLRIRLHTRGAA